MTDTQKILNWNSFALYTYVANSNFFENARKSHVIHSTELLLNPKMSGSRETAVKMMEFFLNERYQVLFSDGATSCLPRIDIVERRDLFWDRF